MYTLQEAKHWIYVEVPSDEDTDSTSVLDVNMGKGKRFKKPCVNF